MVEGLSHITFMVKDLDQMEQVLVNVLDAKKIYDSGDKQFSVAKERFYDIGGIWVAVMIGEPLPTQTYNHVAFKISDDEYDQRLAAIKALGLKVLDGRKRVAGEARSIYFYDYDNHLFELHSGTLKERLRAYAQ
ncbi:FosX/FosE/FosI family fosfomycin resistance hydrolase [Maritalea porphyrae]|uniref:FosX/FosE/FosI family fosfomycin resistance hydrolase n=1 Tax=Maritalea porphyrae TaxID=880732 RepID=UPI0022AEE073|nr:FosX/FosE/FosI family fosfomycin resistance hydrolase [Maritalea porphyrae]MCZ4274205.1 FosX/FosE/FosI family fosfomycin resistance hydrolase [Maritalea porphyrae]